MFSLAFIKDDVGQICRVSKIRDKLGYLLAVILLYGVTLSAAGSSVNLSKAFGGPGGTPFVDLVAPGGRISAITISSGKFIDRIKVEYRYKNTVKRPSHGGPGGKEVSFRLKNREYITEFGGRSGKVVNSIYVKTNKGRVMKWGGKGGQNSFRFTATKSTPFAGVWGRSGGLLDALGVIQKTTTSKSGKAAKLGPLRGFKPGGDVPAVDCGAKCDSAPGKHFPGQPSNQRDKTFWKEHTNKLGAVLRVLAGSERDYTNYLKQEEDICGIYIPCQIDARSSAISFVTGAK
jgi:hypothetical protein